TVAGQYAAAAGTMFLGLSQIRTDIATDDLATFVAVSMLGVVWWRQRQGHSVPTDVLTRAAAAIVALLAVVIAWGVIGAIVRHGPLALVAPFPTISDLQGLPARALDTLPVAPGAFVVLLTALGYCLFAMGGSEALTHIAPELQQPRILHLRRTARLVGIYALIATAGAAFLASALVPQSVRMTWFDAPLAALPSYLPGPAWIRFLLSVIGVVTIALFLTTTVIRSATAVQNLLLRLSDEGFLAGTIRTLHTRFGTRSRVIDLVAIAQAGIIVMSAGQVSWLARIYAIGLVCCALLKIGALIRFRTLRTEPRAFRVPLNIRTAKREWPVGLVVAGGLIGIPAALLIATGDPASIVGAVLVTLLTGLMVVSRTAEGQEHPGAEAFDEFQLLASADAALHSVDARPGNLLVAVRRPHFLAHLTAALQAAGDRDVVAMTVRLVGADSSNDPQSRPQFTEEEHRLFTAVVAIAERYGRAVRLLIVPADNVFDAVAETVVRLHSSEIYTGESETLSADDQARLLGEAWERVPKTEPFDV
ncbi:MAG TPA: hypothetical protein VHI11_12915, partial [Jiangellaceae bacterium]|nr:hypothetical protein [Jiangellaceae bacterium]